MLTAIILQFAGTNASFLSWGSSSTDNNAQNEKPQISLSCLLYGDAGCSKTCQLTALLYGCDTNPECRDNLYCVCNEVYHMPNGDLTTNDFQKMPFDTLWDNTFENTSQANAIRRYIKKNDEMSALVDTLIRDPRVNGEEIKNQLMFKYPDLSSEFKKLISVKRGMKSDLMTGDHLKYEDILDHFNELVTGIQNSDNELQNIKYRRRIGKILESIQDEDELGHLVDLVKLSNNESLYNYVTTVLKKRGYVFDNNEKNYLPAVGVFANGPGSEFHTTNVIREHNLGVDDINEGDMIELSVITNLAQPSGKDAFSPIQIITDENNQQNEVQAILSQIPNAAYTDVAMQIQTPNAAAAYTDGTSQVQTANIVYPEVDLLTTPPGQTSSAAYTEMREPVNANENDALSLSDAVAKIQADLANLDSEVSQLKSASFGVDFAAISDMLNSGNFMGQSNADEQFDQSPQLNIDLNGFSEALDNNFTQQNFGFEDNMPTIMNALLRSNAISTPDASEIDFLNKIPTYMAQVAATPITFPDGVTVSKVMSSSLPTISPSAIENSVHYTISKKIRKMQEGESSPNSVNSSSVVNESPNVVAATYNAAPETVSYAAVEEVSPIPADDRTNALDDGKINTSNSILVNGNFPTNVSPPQPSPLNKPTPNPKQVKNSLTNSDSIAIQSRAPPTKNQVTRKTKVVSTNTPKNQMTTAETVTSVNNPTIMTSVKNPTVTSVNNPAIASVNNPTDAVKAAKITSKTNGVSKEVKNAPTASATQVLTDINQISFSQPPSSGDTVNTLDSTVNTNVVEEEVKIDEAPTVVQSVSNVKKKKLQVSPSKKNGDQTESSVRSMSKTQTTENQADDSLVSVPSTEMAQQTITKTEQTSTQSSSTLEEKTNSKLEEGNEEKLATPVVAQEAISPFGRFGLDQVRRFASSFKKSPSP